MVTGVKDGTEISPQQVGHVLICGANSWLLRPDASDCHAEANAIAESAALGLCLAGATCYVSKEPCKDCFKLLAIAGIKRIVAPGPMESRLQKHVIGLGISEVVVNDTKKRKERRERLASKVRDWAQVYQLRYEKKNNNLNLDERIEINWQRNAR